MKHYKYIFWDLDGTLLDTYEGVSNCVRYALDYYGIISKTGNAAEIHRAAPAGVFSEAGASSAGVCGGGDRALPGAVSSGGRV